MQETKEENEKDYLSHSVPAILRHEKEEDTESESRGKILHHHHHHHRGTRSAFKEVRKRKSRFNPIDSGTKKDELGTTEKTEARLITPRLLANPYNSFQAAAYGVVGGNVTAVASIEGHRYPYVTPRLGEVGTPPMGVAFPYGTLPFFSHPPRPTIYFRDPFVLAAQNCCAKCGVQFRMTSDLVYHMRTHHKHELAAEGCSRERKPAEKYQCNVCQESFKEKHHLSRHMTSHDS